MTVMEMSSPTEKQSKISEYINTRNHYFLNAKECIARGELRKASELVWGSVAQEIKAVAAVANKDLVKHGEFFPFMTQLSKEVTDPSLYQVFVEVNTLHRNFYDEFIPSESFPFFYAKAIGLIEKIDQIIQEKARKELAH